MTRGGMPRWGGGRMPRDSRTRYQGVYARHKQSCLSHLGRDCNCVPAFWGKVYDRASGKERKTRMFGTPTTARQARAELEVLLRRGRGASTSTMRVKAATEAFLRAVENGTALNKFGKEYKENSVRDLKGAFARYINKELGRMRVADVRRRDVQRLVDGMTGKKSGSTIRTVVNAIHTLYGWLQYRELVEEGHDPATGIRLPAMDAEPRDRVLTIPQMDALLAVLSPADAMPYALASGAGARWSEIRFLLIGDMDFDEAMVYLGEDPRGRKSPAARRPVPLIRGDIVVTLARRRILEMGRPGPKKLLCPGIRGEFLSREGLQERVDDTWAEHGLVRVTLHECRHFFVSWCDAAGIRRSVISWIVGHSPDGGGGARVTARYTHRLPDDLARAREQLAAYAASQRASAGAVGQ